MSSRAIDLPAGDLTGRRAAVPVRLQTQALIAAGTTVRFNLGAVLSLSDSYADELFGVLVLEFGLVRALDHIVLVNASDAVVRVIAEAVARRSQERGEDPTKLAAG